MSDDERTRLIVDVPAPRLEPSGARVHAGNRDALKRLPVLVVRLVADPEGRPREALVLRDGSGALRAYRNLCQHLPIPLDSGSRSFMHEGDLQCRTHGARYRTSDGVCVHGPCEGARLEPLAVEEVDDEIFVLDPNEPR